MAQDSAALRTRIYIDGYNLYYGCLKRTPYKWLDLQALFNLLPTRDNTRKPNHELEQTAHWMRSQILESELAASQLPPMIRDGSRVIHKPFSWYPRPDLFIPIFEEAKRVRRSHGAALKWLNQPCERLDGRVPVKMAENDAEAGELRAYMDKYAQDFSV